jgi:hypothetical protein
MCTYGFGDCHNIALKFFFYFYQAILDYMKRKLIYRIKYVFPPQKCNIKGKLYLNVHESYLLNLVWIKFKKLENLLFLFPWHDSLWNNHKFFS